MTNIVKLSFFCVMFLVSCSKKGAGITPHLNNEIEKYIIDCVDKDEKPNHRLSNEIYIVKYKRFGSTEFVKITESNYYYKENLSGYLVLKDRKVFFYDLPDNIVDLLELNTEVDDTLPDEFSEEAESGYHSKSTFYYVDEKERLEKIGDESFYFY